MTPSPTPALPLRVDVKSPKSVPFPRVEIIKVSIVPREFDGCTLPPAANPLVPEDAPPQYVLTAVKSPKLATTPWCVREKSNISSVPGSEPLKVPVMTALVLLDEPEWFLVPAVDKSLHSSALPLLENIKLEISGVSVPIPLKPLT